MKILVILDCIKLNDFEKILLLAIKAICHDYRQQTMMDERFNKRVYPNIIITISTIENGMTLFNVENSVRGLFYDVKKIIKPFTDLYLQGGFNDETKTTKLILQRFEIKK